MIYRKYADYLKSDAWKERRRRILARDGFKCVLCGSGINLNVHHLTYINKGHEEDDDLVTLCQKCHEKVHKEDIKTKKGPSMPPHEIFRNFIHGGFASLATDYTTNKEYPRSSWPYSSSLFKYGMVCYCNGVYDFYNVKLLTARAFIREEHYEEEKITHLSFFKTFDDARRGVNRAEIISRLPFRMLFNTACEVCDREKEEIYG